MLKTLISLALLVAPASAGDLWTVDASGSGDFASLQDAIDFAANGDVIVVTGPLASSVVDLDGKALSLVAEGQGLLDGTVLSVRNVSAQDEVYLVGLTDLWSLRLCDNLGRVVVESCRASVAPIEVDACADVVFSDTTSIGYTHWTCTSGGQNGGTAMQVQDGSRVTLYGSTLVGGDGVPDCLPNGYEGEGGFGLYVSTGSSVVAYACDIRGGTSSDGFSATAVLTTSGGVYTVGATPPAELIGPTLSDAGDVAMLRVEATPGHAAWLILSTAGQRRVLPPTIGILHLAPPLALQFLGVVPGSGLLTAPVTTPLVPLGAEAERFWAQVMLTQPSGSRYLGNAKGWVVRQ